MIAVTWARAELNIYLGGRCAGSTNPRNVKLKSFNVVPHIPIHVVDHSAASKKAIERRRHTFGGTHPKPNRRHGGREYLFRSLSDEFAQIRDLLSLMSAGQLHHAPGLAARIRLLIVAGNPLPLMQQCAASIDEPLTLYVGPQQTVDPDHPLTPTTAVINAFPVGPSPISNNPVDLDVWLGLPAIWMDGRILTNRDALKQIGDTVGSHLDVDIQPSIDLLRQQKVMGQHDLMTMYLSQVGAVVMSLCEYLLERRASDQSV